MCLPKQQQADMTSIYFLTKSRIDTVYICLEPSCSFPPFADSPNHFEAAAMTLASVALLACGCRGAYTCCHHSGVFPPAVPHKNHCFVPVP